MHHINHLKWQRKQKIGNRIDRLETTEKYCIAIECRIRKSKCESGYTTDHAQCIECLYENR